MGGKASRRKGHDFERSLVRLFKKAFPDSPVTILRGLQAARSFEPDVRLGRFWIEAKVGARPRPLAAMKQAQFAASMDGLVGDIPVAVIKEDYVKDSVVVMKMADWIQLVQDAGGPKPENAGQEVNPWQPLPGYHRAPCEECGNDPDAKG